jgi:hypothetical protein
MMRNQVDKMQCDINKLDDYKRVLDYVMNMLPFIRSISHSKESSYSPSINDDFRATQTQTT